MTSPVSIAAYHAIPDLDKRQKRVYNCIQRNPLMSANDVARHEKMDVKNVRNRIVELRNMGLIKKSSRQRDSLTGHMVTKYEAVR